MGAPAEKAPQRVAAIVAPGRTVYAEAVTAKVWDPDSKSHFDRVKAAGPRGPGETVELPAEEVWRLRAAGFLLPEGVRAASVAVQPGPQVAVSDGPSVRVIQH